MGKRFTALNDHLDICIDRGMDVQKQVFSKINIIDILSTIWVVIAIICISPWLLFMYIIGHISIYREKKRLAIVDVGD